jgi:predicted MFS family arabinose efflux permease
MGVGGGLLLATIQAALADHHGERRTVALAEANVAASIGYVVLIGMLSLTSALHAGWRVALLASLAVPALAWWSNRRLTIDAPPPSRVARGRLPGVFWIAAAMLFCTTAAEWCITAWGATFVEDAAEVPTDTAVALMADYFGGGLAGRTLGSRLARRHHPARLLALALAVTAAGSRLTHFGTAADVTVAELRLEAFLPADEATASNLTNLGRTTARRG